MFRMTSSNGNIFRVTGPLCGEFTGHRWIPRTKGQWRGALMCPLICTWINGWLNNREAGDLRRHCAHNYVTVMTIIDFTPGMARNMWNRKILVFQENSSQLITFLFLRNDRKHKYVFVFSIRLSFIKNGYSASKNEYFLTHRRLTIHGLSWQAIFSNALPWKKCSSFNLTQAQRSFRYVQMTAIQYWLRNSLVSNNRLLVASNIGARKMHSFAKWNLKCISVRKKLLKYCSLTIDHKSAKQETGDKQLSEPNRTRNFDAIRRHWATMS